MRKLVSIRKIKEIKKIDGADKICSYNVDGWWVVDTIDKYKVGDLVVYFEIDSWIPHELAPFLSKGNVPREYGGVKGERLKTIRLRGQLSQGLLLHMSVIEKFGNLFLDDDGQEVYIGFKNYEDGTPVIAYLIEGADLTDMLGIQKWEAPISAQMAGVAKGNFPTNLIPKTDQERIQNCFKEIQRRDGLNLTEKFWNAATQTLEEVDAVMPEGFVKPTYEVSLKLDGSSCTIFRYEGVLRVCSRNLELQISEENEENIFVKMALRFGDIIPDGYAFQGEIWGESIQGNREKIKGQHFSIFDIFDIKSGEYISPINRRKMLTELGISDLHVPILGEDWNAPKSVAEGLAMAEGPSIHHKIREGLVWKCNEDPSFSFKTISNLYLLKSEA